MMHFTNNVYALAVDVKNMLSNLGYRPTIAKIWNGTKYKYLVRVARKNEITKVIQELSLYKR